MAYKTISFMVFSYTFIQDICSFGVNVTCSCRPSNKVEFLIDMYN
jgi:hypothetical protein